MLPRKHAIWLVLISVILGGLLSWAVTQPPASQHPPAPASSARDDAGDARGDREGSGSPESSELLQLEARVVQVYRRVNPSVVNVTSTVVSQGFFGPVPQQGMGSGFVYDKEGRIITNHHVIEGARKIEVTFPDGTIETARVVGADSRNDLAVLDVDVSPEKLRPVELGSSDDLQPGQVAISIGNPFGLERTVTTGVISAVGRTLELSDGRLLFGLIQTDASINQGNSGGPLLDSHGRVIGINSLIFSPSGGSVGVGFAIPVGTLKREIAALIERGRYPHPWLGVAGYTLTPELARRVREAGLTVGAERGVVIAQVVPGGPADRADLRGGDRQVIIGNRQLVWGGDIITAMDGTRVTSMEELARSIETQTEVGQSVALTIVRDGEEMTAHVPLGERPPDR